MSEQHTYGVTRRWGGLLDSPVHDGLDILVTELRADLKGERGRESSSTRVAVMGRAGVVYVRTTTVSRMRSTASLLRIAAGVMVPSAACGAHNGRVHQESDWGRAVAPCCSHFRSLRSPRRGDTRGCPWDALGVTTRHILDGTAHMTLAVRVPTMTY